MLHCIVKVINNTKFLSLSRHYSNRNIFYRLAEKIIATLLLLLSFIINHKSKEFSNEVNNSTRIIFFSFPFKSQAKPKHVQCSFNFFFILFYYFFSLFFLMIILMVYGFTWLKRIYFSVCDKFVRKP